jgi:hypothetical protein
MPNRIETRVNTYTTANQDFPQITALSDGGWVITWLSYGQDGDGYGIYAQAYNADGSAQGGETPVNTYTISMQVDQQITALSDGGWVITWRSYGQDGSNYGIYARAYNADGSAQGGETRVNTYTTDYQDTPQITALSDGGWVITWASEGQDTSSYGIYAQAYNADGTAQGIETQVNTYVAGNQDTPQITALSDGGWVITWQSEGQDGSSWGVYAQAYNADGTRQGGETQVNTYWTSYQQRPQITALSDGGWVITWQSLGQDEDSYGIYAQAYNADGTKQGGETQVNTYTTGVQVDQQITALSDGGWVITWRSDCQDGDGSCIYAQAYNADGTAQGGETQVNTYVASMQDTPQITALSDGGWVITWKSEGQDGSTWGVYAQAYNADGTAQGGETQVNTYTTGTQNNQQITALSDGGWVITWVSDGQDGSFSGIYSHAFAPLSADDISVAITGTQTVGETLTAELTGISATNNTLEITYVWLADGVVVETGPDATFTLTTAHANAVITVIADINDTLVVDPPLEFSAPTDPIDNGINDAPTGSVTISGTVTRGQTLTVDATAVADWDGIDAGTVAYQWLRGGVAISGATGSTYDLAQADVGSAISVRYSFTDDGAANEAVTSAATATVANVNDSPTGSVTISGTLTQGQTLFANATAVADADGIDAGTVAYQWLRGRAEISGATGSTYDLAQADVGSAISVRYSFTDDGAANEAVTSGSTAIVANVNDSPTGSVTVNGTAEYGQTLFADTTLVADADGLRAFSYQWLRGGAAISGATDSSYEVRLGDVGHNIRMQVSYTDGEGTAESFTSAVYGVEPNLTLVGNHLDNTLSGASGDDRLFGAEGNDRLKGRGGDDMLDGGEDNDTLNGGSGSDRLLGGEGRDTLSGSNGSDVLRGNEGRDNLNGGGGRDNLNGGAGRDVLVGGTGKDTLTGGADSDVFKFNRTAGSNTITDFEDGLDFIEITNGANRFNQLTIAADGSDAIVTFGAVEITLKNIGMAELSAADFLFT